MIQLEVLKSKWIKKVIAEVLILVNLFRKFDKSTILHQKI